MAFLKSHFWALITVPSYGQSLTFLERKTTGANLEIIAKKNYLIVTAPPWRQWVSCAVSSGWNLQPTCQQQNNRAPAASFAVWTPKHNITVFRVLPLWDLNSNNIKENIVKSVILWPKVKQAMATNVFSTEYGLCVKTYGSCHSCCDRWLSEYFFHVDDRQHLQIWSHVLLQLALLEHFHVVASSQNTMRSNQHGAHIVPLLISDS